MPAAGAAAHRSQMPGSAPAGMPAALLGEHPQLPSGKRTACGPSCRCEHAGAAGRLCHQERCPGCPVGTAAAPAAAQAGRWQEAGHRCVRCFLLGTQHQAWRLRARQLTGCQALDLPASGRHSRCRCCARCGRSPASQARQCRPRRAPPALLHEGLPQAGWSCCCPAAAGRTAAACPPSLGGRQPAGGWQGPARSAVWHALPALPRGHAPSALPDRPRGLPAVAPAAGPPALPGRPAAPHAPRQL